MVEESCAALVSWLDAKLADWSIEPNPRNRKTEIESNWEMSATGRSVGRAQLSVQGTLSAIHRARSGVAHIPLKERMKDARSAILPKFADSMEIEGRLEVEVSSREKFGILRAAVEEPR